MLISTGNFPSQSQENYTCQDIGQLVHYMLTEQPIIVESQTSQQNMLQLHSTGFYINNTDSKFSVCGIDFLEKCMSKSSDVQQHLHQLLGVITLYPYEILLYWTFHSIDLSQLVPQRTALSPSCLTRKDQRIGFDMLIWLCWVMKRD